MNGFILRLITLSLLTTGCDKEPLETWNKEPPTPSFPKQPNSGGNQNQNNTQGSGGGQPGFRVVSPNTGICYNDPVNCNPKDTIILGSTLENLDLAILNNNVAELFGNEEIAQELIPDFNEDYMLEIKTKILSGEYTFRSEGYDNNVIMYFL